MHVNLQTEDVNQTWRCQSTSLSKLFCVCFHTIMAAIVNSQYIVTVVPVKTLIVAGDKYYIVAKGELLEMHSAPTS